MTKKTPLPNNKLPTDKLFFLPVSGCEEIGMNLNIYGYKDELIIADLGVKFSKDLGRDVIIPDYRFLEQHADKIKGLFVTHAHEDHIGAIPAVWDKIKCPVYCSQFAALVLENKLKEYNLDSSKIINVVPNEGIIKAGTHFKIEFVNITHSLPEPNVFAIHTPKGVIVHTGDWKIDNNPLVGEVSNSNRLKEIGDKGVLALVCDSTNIFNEGTSGSEKDVFDNLLKIVKKCKHRAIISCFASNIARLDTIARIAKACDRKIVSIGRSMKNMENIARNCGYLRDTAKFGDTKLLDKLKREETLILCTGSQGEERAALRRLANDEIPGAKLETDDTVIFSSRCIPGNEETIKEIQEGFIDQGLLIVNSRTDFVHVSGHPCQEELKQMYSWIKPKTLIPVHGNKENIVAHSNFAKENGIEHSVVLNNGDVLNLETLKVIDNIAPKKFVVDNNIIIPYDDPLFKDRLELSKSGVVFVSLMISQGKILGRPYISLKGTCGAITEDFINKKILNALDKLSPDKNSVEFLTRSLKRALSKIVFENPDIIVHVFKIKKSN